MPPVGQPKDLIIGAGFIGALLLLARRNGKNFIDTPAVQVDNLENVVPVSTAMSGRTT